MNCSDEFSVGESSPRWLEPNEYLALAVSNRRMARCDDPDRGVRGLVDLATGESFFVREQHSLFGELNGWHPRDAVSS
jgi:hypothetical protein